MADPVSSVAFCEGIKVYSCRLHQRFVIVTWRLTSVGEKRRETSSACEEATLVCVNVGAPSWKLSAADTLLSGVDCYIPTFLSLFPFAEMGCG